MSSIVINNHYVYHLNNSIFIKHGIIEYKASYILSHLITFIASFPTRASLVAQAVKHPPAMQETWVQSLGWEEPLEKGMAAHSSFLAQRILIDRGVWWATVHGVTKNWTQLSD